MNDIFSLIENILKSDLEQEKLFRIQHAHLDKLGEFLVNYLREEIPGLRYTIIFDNFFAQIKFHTDDIDMIMVNQLMAENSDSAEYSNLFDLFEDLNRLSDFLVVENVYLNRKQRKEVEKKLKFLLPQAIKTTKEVDKEAETLP